MEPHNSFMSSHKDQIVLSKRQASMIMASMVIFCLFVFIVGFFLGKRTVVDEFSSTVTENALHDQIDYILTTQSLKTSQEDNFSDEPVDEASSTEAVVSSSSIVTEQKQVTKVVEEPSVQQVPSINVDSSIKDSQYACLIGFGTKNAANAFVTRLKKHHVPVILKTVISKTASGKVRTWYQAITPTYDSASELQEVVNKVKRLEHIRDNDIKIVHVK